MQEVPRSPPTGDTAVRGGGAGRRPDAAAPQSEGPAGDQSGEPSPPPICPPHRRTPEGGPFHWQSPEAPSPRSLQRLQKRELPELRARLTHDVRRLGFGIGRAGRTKRRPQKKPRPEWLALELLPLPPPWRIGGRRSVPPE